MKKKTHIDFIKKPYNACKEHSEIGLASDGIWWIDYCKTCGKIISQKRMVKKYKEHWCNKVSYFRIKKIA